LRQKREEKQANGAEPSAQLERWRKARADLSELALNRESGTLVSRAEVVAFASEACAVVTMRLNAHVRNVAAALGTACGDELMVEEIVQREVDDILAGFERGLDRATALKVAAEREAPDAAPASASAPTSSANNELGAREVVDLGDAANPLPAMAAPTEELKQ
jgi:hypothetical protein